MENAVAPAENSRTAWRESLVLMALSATALVLASMDQSTRGPSITGMLLAHMSYLF